jgi:hypothetical protein
MSCKKGDMISTRREPLTVNAINPSDGKSYEVQVSHAKLMACARRSIGQIKEAAEVVPMILQHPGTIFRGLCRDMDEPGVGFGRLCYCGIPTKAYRQDGAETAPWPGYVFLVFVSDDNVAYNWYWSKADSDTPNLPEGHEIRFKEKAL